MDKQFPIISASAPVPCFNCDRPIMAAPEYDATQARGQWRAYCKTCDMHTFFDRTAA